VSKADVVGVVVPDKYSIRSKIQLHIRVTRWNPGLIEVDEWTNFTGHFTHPITLN
jgi:hypothetical protein